MRERRNEEEGRREEGLGRGEDEESKENEGKE